MTPTSSASPDTAHDQQSLSKVFIFEVPGIIGPWA
jgi:hypothetical protein